MPETDPTARRRRGILSACGAAVLVAGGVWWFLRQGQKVDVPVAVVPAEVDGGKLATNSDAAEIFQRAFWKRPRPEDKILHGERREWTSETGGVRKWEWFLAVEPGSGLLEELKQRFHLTGAGLTPEKFSTAPDWFRGALKKSSTVFASTEGSMILVVSDDQRLLLAMDSGAGFAKPVTNP